jgi:hypothetical protein
MRSANHFRDLIVMVLVLAARAAPAQQATAPRDSARPHRSLCLRERLAGECDKIVVFEVGTFFVLNTTHRALLPTGETNGAFPWHVAWDLGVMRNLSGRSALGVMGEAGFSKLSYRLALEPRYRRRLPAAFSADVAAGPLWTHIGEARESGGVGATAELRINYRDYVGLIGRVDAMHTAEFGSARAVYAGIALRDEPAAFTTGGILGLATLVALLAWIAPPSGDY